MSHRLPLSLSQAHSCISRSSACICFETKVQFSEASDSYPSPQHTRLLGLCTGAIAAAAVGCARSVLELLPLAVTAVAVAFRTGLCAADAGKRTGGHEAVQAFIHSSQPWSIVAAGPGASHAVQAFCTTSVSNCSNLGPWCLYRHFLLTKGYVRHFL